MTRLPRWSAVLFEEIERRSALPFRWGAIEGAQDCCTFAAGVIDAIAGTSHLEAIARTYIDEAGALAFIELHGGLPGAVSQFLGELQDIRYTRRGDAVLVDEGQLLVGICTGPSVAVVGARGVEYRKSSLIRYRWGV